MLSALRRAVLPAFLLVAPWVRAQQPVGELFSSSASVRGAVSLSGSGTRVLSGSQVTAGEAPALLRLERGGQLQVCPRTTLSLTADAAGKTLVLGMNAGSLEVDYALASAADSLLTPDFRMQLISPGHFHFAISVAPSGDTCLRSLPGNTASIFVAEMMGTDSYQLSPGRAVLFKAGRISGATEPVASCGCSAASWPKAAMTPTLPPAAAAAPAPAVPEAPPSAAQKPAHLEVDTQFTYHGQDHRQDIVQIVTKLRSSRQESPLALSLLPQVTPPAVAAKAQPPQPTGFFGRLKRALKRIFVP